MATDSLVACLCGSTITLFLLLLLPLVMPMSVETEMIRNTDVSRLSRRRIPGLKPVSVDELGFASLKKEADKHTETFVESGEFVVNIGGPNASRFFVAVRTPAPSSIASTVVQQQQQEQQNQPQRQQPKVQQWKMEKQRQRQQQQQHRKWQQGQPPRQQHQRRRRHRKVRQNDAMDDETEVEAFVIEDDDASSVVRKQREPQRRSRQWNQKEEEEKEEEESSSERAYDKYFRKQSIDDYFRKSEEDDEFMLRERRKLRSGIVPNGIETDVTVIEDTGEDGGRDFERGLVQRDAGPSSVEVIDPERDGSLTLSKLASVLNANESIERLQLFSDNPSLSVRWEEPAMMSNCWLHKMLANRYSFSPSCQPDGTYYNKQCYLERCWCVDDEGRPRDRKFLTRFAYKKYGSLLYCSPQLHPVVSGNLLRPPESEFQMIVHTARPMNAADNPASASAAQPAASAAQPAASAAQQAAPAAQPAASAAQPAAPPAQPAAPAAQPAAPAAQPAAPAAQ